VDIRALLLATISFGIAGCPSTWNCKPDSEEVSLEGADVTMADIQYILDGWGHEDSTSIECYQVCATAYRRTRGWEVSVEDADCSYSLDETIEPAADTGAFDGDEVVGSVTCSGTGFEYYCEGRRPLGHLEETACGDDLGGYLAHCAHLEAASTTAFRQLAAQLRRWGAPADLIDRCLRAAREESEHADTVTALATARGGDVVAPRRQPAEETLLQVALHNATEGCVFETWAALAAYLKAGRAEDAEVRSAYARIAQEEAGHGQLAWDLHAWLMGQLSAAEQAQVRAAQRDALARLPQIAAAQARRTPAALGMPAPDTVAEMAAHLRTRLAA